MALNKVSGNMYEFVTHTFNSVKGKCPHGCTYCYMNVINKRFNKISKEPYLYGKELKANLGSGNFIFVGSSIDMFTENMKFEYISPAIDHCKKYRENTYLFQSKNPNSMLPPGNRAFGMNTLKYNNDCFGFELFITIEPILDFDLDGFIELLKHAIPDYINIGADSGNNHLPEPPKEKVLEFIAELEKFTDVHLKSNLKRIIV